MSTDPKPRNFKGRTFILLLVFLSAMAQIVYLIGQEGFINDHDLKGELGAVIIFGGGALSLLLVPVSLFLVLRHRRFSFLLAVAGMFMPAAFLYYSSYEGPDERLFLLLGGLLTGLFFLYAVRIRSRLFIFLLAVVLLGLGWLWALAIFLITATFKLVWHLFRENRRTFAALGFKTLFTSYFRALLLWSPMLLVIVPSFYFSKYVENKAEEAMYEQTFMEHCGPQAKDDFTHNLDCSLDPLFLDIENQVKAKLAEIRKAGETKSADLPTDVGDIIRGGGVLPPTSVDLDCSWYRVDCHAANGAADIALSATNKAFKQTLIKIGDNTEDKLRTALGSSNKDLQGKITKVESILHDTLQQQKRTARRWLMRAHTSLILFLLVLDLLFFFVVVKSFSYVFARVVFSREKGGEVSLAVPGISMAKGEIRTTGNKYGIAARTRKDWYVSRRYEPAGRAPKVSFPQWTRGILPRLLGRCWAMNHIVMEQGRPAVQFNAAVGIEFIEWKLQPGETVIFSYGDFVAMTEDVTLSRIISLKLETLLLGKMIFSTATGPGTLILRTKGNAAVGTQRAATSSVPQQRILAWQRNTRFHVESELNVLDIFFSGVYLRKKASDLVVIDSDQTGKAKSGIWRFFLHFLLPN